MKALLSLVACFLMAGSLKAENYEDVKMQIIYQNYEEESEVIRQGLGRFNTPFFGYKEYVDFVVCFKDENQQVMGGVIAWMRPGIHLLCIDTIWVAEHLRNQGNGTKLMLAAEQEGVKHGCDHSQLETLSFQAKGFHEKLGYEQIGFVEKLYGEHDAYYMRKILTQP